MKTGWITTTLDDACIVEYGTRVVQKKDGGSIYPAYGGGGATFLMNTFNRSNRLIVSRFGMSEQCTRFVHGDFFLNDSGLTVAPKSNYPLTQAYLDKYLLHRNDQIFDLGKGSAQKNLDVPAFRQLKISFPEAPSEQSRIVILLDEAFADIATAKANAEKNLQNVREVFETHLRNLLNARSTEGIETTLQKCCDQIFAGGDVPKDRVSSEKTATYPVPIFSNGAKDDGLYGFTDTARVTKPSVTVSARGTLGFSAIRNEPFLPVVRLIVLTPNENLIDLSFLHYTVLGMDFENTGTSIPQLTVPNFKDLSIYLPPLSKQKELVLALDSIRNETQNLESIYRQKLTALDDLKKSLLHQAFSGQL